MTVEALWAKHGENRCDVRSAREHIFPWLNWDTSFNGYIGGELRVWYFDPFLIVNCLVK